MFSKWNSIYTALTGEEKPAVMLALLSLLVIVLHVNSVLWLSRPMATTKTLKPLLMEVTILPAPIKKPEIEPVKPKPIEEPKKKPPPVKPKLKPKPVAVQKPKPKPTPTPIQKPKPVVRTVAMDKSVETEPKAESIAPVPVVETPVHQPPVSHHAKAPEQPSSAVKRHNLAGEAGGTCTPESLHTPRPPYPQSARNRHIEGAGRISFVITAEGHTDQVRLSQSSGYDILDEAALNAVQKWKYATTQPCQASVPFSFKLH